MDLFSSEMIRAVMEVVKNPISLRRRCLRKTTHKTFPLFRLKNRLNFTEQGILFSSLCKWSNFSPWIFFLSAFFGLIRRRRRLTDDKEINKNTRMELKATPKIRATPKNEKKRRRNSLFISEQKFYYAIRNMTSLWCFHLFLSSTVACLNLGEWEH